MAAVENEKALPEKTKFRLNWVYRTVKGLIGEKYVLKFEYIYGRNPRLRDH